VEAFDGDAQMRHKRISAFSGGEPGVVHRSTNMGEEKAVQLVSMTMQNNIVLTGAAIVVVWMCYACIANRARRSKPSPKRQRAPKIVRSL
jgi:hypothetical protein